MIDDHGQHAPNHQGERWDELVTLRGRPFYGKISLGNWTSFRVAMFYLHADQTGFGLGISFPALFVAVEGKGAYTFSSWAHWSYVAEKLDMMEGDARNMADLINAQLGASGAEEQGRYLNIT
jgi:hypothetical protein